MVLVGGRATQRDRGRMYKLQVFSRNHSKRGLRSLLITRFGLKQTINFPGKTEFSQASILGGAGFILGWELELLETMLVFV